MLVLAQQTKTRNLPDKNLIDAEKATRKAYLKPKMVGSSGDRKEKPGDHFRTDGN